VLRAPAVKPSRQLGGRAGWAADLCVTQAERTTTRIDPRNRAGLAAPVANEPELCARAGRAQPKGHPVESHGKPAPVAGFCATKTGAIAREWRRR
jgi:hypothetical protein